MSSDSFLFVLFIRAFPGVVLIIRVLRACPGGRWVHSGSPWGSSGSFEFVRFVRARLGSCRVHLDSWGSFKRDMRVVGFIQVHSDSFRFIQVHWVRLGGRLVHSDSLGSLGRALDVVWFIRRCTAGRPVHSGSDVR